ncbi:hypothetical protein NPIL_241991 [Nephila pilipes]|uniref:Uncharacterized protein n=1 Tax=Nephila pilipes TaxID=299642 RepID=A0A8X6MVQ5_NEPPI|nr:hypothetical protein NPIL_241991 [Nephila pilipes]
MTTRTQEEEEEILRNGYSDHFPFKGFIEPELDGVFSKNGIGDPISSLTFVSTIFRSPLSSERHCLSFSLLALVLPEGSKPDRNGDKKKGRRKN